MKIQKDAVITRNKMGSLVKSAHRQDSCIELDGVEFISRAAADELVYMTNELEVDISGLSGTVKTIVTAVRNNTEYSED
jgi:hypothetical protein